tara:strand:- start:92 stop:445 length:354 start_codon:yes stop_codon:yes gene_type:complete
MVDIEIFGQEKYPELYQSIVKIGYSYEWDGNFYAYKIIWDKVGQLKTELELKEGIKLPKYMLKAGGGCLLSECESKLESLYNVRVIDSVLIKDFDVHDTIEEEYEDFKKLVEELSNI